jgi:hypothetical protein
MRINVLIQIEPGPAISDLPGCQAWGRRYEPSEI